MSQSDESFSPRAREPEKSSSTCLILGFVFGGVGAAVLLCGGCCVGLVFVGLNQIGSEIQTDLAGNEVIQEHIGNIQTFEMDKWKSIEHANEDVYVFRITGPNGSGTIEAECIADDEGTYHVQSGELKMDSGETFDLFPDGNPNLTDTVNDAIEGMFDSDTLDASSDEFARQVQIAVENNPVFMQRVGTVSEFTYDLDMSINEPGADTYVFHVKGSNGSGTLRAECITVDADTENVPSAELILDSGEHVQLYPEKPLP